MTPNTYYEPVPISERPLRAGRYFVIAPDDGMGMKGYYDQVWHIIKPEGCRWLRPTTGYLFTPEELKKVMEDAWHACYLNAVQGGENPDRDTFINSVLNK